MTETLQSVLDKVKAREAVKQIPDRKDIREFLRVADPKKYLKGTPFDEVYKVFRQQYANGFGTPLLMDDLELALRYFCAGKVFQLSKDFESIAMENNAKNDEVEFVLYHDYSFGLAYPVVPIMAAVSERRTISTAFNFLSPARPEHIRIIMQRIGLEMRGAGATLGKDPTGFKTIDEDIDRLGKASLKTVLRPLVIGGAQHASLFYKTFYREMAHRALGQ